MPGGKGDVRHDNHDDSLERQAAYCVVSKTKGNSYKKKDRKV